MMRAVSPILLVLLLGGATLVGEAQLQRLDIDKQETRVRVSWVMQSEDGVKEYVVKRKAPYQSEYGPVKDGKNGKVTQLLGAGAEYQVMDSDLYKGAVEEVHYRLEVHYRDGSPPDIWEESITYQPTAVRRTWGSIKAMFQ